MKSRWIILAIGILFSGLVSGQHIEGTVTDLEGNPLPAQIFIEGTSFGTKTNETGEFKFQISPGTYNLVAFSPGYQSILKQIEVRENLSVSFLLNELNTELPEVLVTDHQLSYPQSDWLKSVSGSAIYDGKKSELIQLDEVVGNKSANLGRQMYARVPGLNIWESDGAGVQLGIGGRGLNPNRTSNFNVRQNGYDISADALGYPESYYTPPVQALRRIEIVRGAAGLQYGTQFGGLLNFVFKEGPKDEKLDVNLINTAGSFGFYNSFNSVGGTVGKVNYYSFYQYKRSEGWRPNSGLEQHTAYGSVTYNFTPFSKLKLEHTHMNYLAKQPGGLTDNQFRQDPRQSNRTRNWFTVGWDLSAAELDIQLKPGIKLNNRTFFLNANRYALGNLGRIDRPDDMDSRDLLMDEYMNWGNETRLLWHYDLLSSKSVLLVGNRIYFGNTRRVQGDGDEGGKPNFKLNNPEDLGDSKFLFPGQNMSLFAENIFNLSEHLSVTPGVRFEYIVTKADGYYVDRRTDLAGNIVFESQVFEEKVNPRSLLLGGIGVSYKYTPALEFYGNFSQNFRGINFNDIRVDNPSLQVDSLISDERGYNVDLGMRGSRPGIYRFDFSGFYLSYDDRIGSVLRSAPDSRFNNLIERTFRYRTNIADAAIYGFEFFGEINWLGVWSKPNELTQLKTFLNLSVISSRYLSNQDNSVEGNFVELVPPVNLRTGITYQNREFAVSYLLSFVEEHYSDATNAETSPTSVEGIIPSYFVMDLSLSYAWKWMSYEAGVNNLANEMYFTRRAAGYPGPGILPSDGRSFYFTLGLNF